MPTLPGKARTAYPTRLIPTTSVEQYAATLARWFGVGESVLPDLFPHLSRFPVQNLGFMG